MNCITIELCAEDRARLDRLADAMEAMAKGQDRPPCDTCVAQIMSFVDHTQANAARSAAAAPAPEAVAIVAEETVEASAPVVVSLAEFQKALTLRCSESEEMKAKVRALLHEYAAAASQVPEDKRSEVLARLAKL